MTRVLEGIRVLDVTQWAFVPSAGAVLADWGATVLKIEHPEQGDPMRGLQIPGLVPAGGAPANVMWELPNRGKRSIGIDLAQPEGRDLIHRLAATCDVFLTSFLPSARRRLGIDVDDIRKVNPKIVYARGHGQGSSGPEAEDGGYDSSAFWARWRRVDGHHTGGRVVAHPHARPRVRRPHLGDGPGRRNRRRAVAP